MAVTIRVSGIKELANGPVAVFVALTADRVKARAKALAPKETGKLARSIERAPVKIRGLHVRDTIGTRSGYGLFPEDGTGIFGPTGRRIFPRTKPFLVFRPRGMGHVIRVRSVRGQKPQHFMRNALVQVIETI